MLSTLLLSLVLSASAGNGKTPPGLERVCEEIQPDVTTAEVAASTFEALTNPPPCDLTAERGICLFGKAFAVMSPTLAVGAVPVETTVVEPGFDEAAYLLSFQDIAGATPGDTVTISVNGATVVKDEPVDDGFVVLEGLVRPPLTTRRWTHVVLVHGKEVPFDLTVTDTPVETAADVRIVGTGDDGSTKLALRATGITPDRGSYYIIEATIDVTYENAVQ